MNTDRYCAKELVLSPGPALPRAPPPALRRHAGQGGDLSRPPRPVELCVDGRLHPLGEGEQYTIPPDTVHWFKAGPDGAIVSEFSSTSRDDLDVFTDPAITRAPSVGA